MQKNDILLTIFNMSPSLQAFQGNCNATFFYIVCVFYCVEILIFIWRKILGLILQKETEKFLKIIMTNFRSTVPKLWQG